MNCFHCIPEFVWELIFEALKDDPLALFNCLSACSAWKVLLTPKQMDFMMSLVLPLIAKHLSFGDLKQCRLVTRHWRTAVDGLNERVPELYPDFTEERMAATFIWKVKPLPFNGWTQWQVPNYSSECPRMMDDFKIQTSNPYPSRIVHFHSFDTALHLNADLSFDWSSVPPPRMLGKRLCLRLEKEFLEMVGIFGCHIWHLIYSISTSLREGRDYYRNIVRLLSCTPNIRSLTLRIPRCSEEFAAHVHPFDRLPHWLSFEECPLPAPLLPNLTDLRLPRLSPSIARLLITAYAPQLRSLESFDLNLHNQDDQKTFEFPQLKTLKLWKVGGYRFHLRSSVAAPVLDKLFLRLDDGNLFGVSIPHILPGLVDSLENFSTSLVQLWTYGRYVSYIHGIDGQPKESVADLEMRHPSACRFKRLKIFRINILFALYPYLRWLLTKFPVIETLHLERNIGWETTASSVQFGGDDGLDPLITDVKDKFLADLWEAAPTLREIYVGKSNQAECLVKRPH